MRYIYDDLVRTHGDPQVAPQPVPLTIRDWHRERRQVRVRQEEVLRGVAGRPNAVRAED